MWNVCRRRPDIYGWRNRFRDDGFTIVGFQHGLTQRAFATELKKCGSAADLTDTNVSYSPWTWRVAGTLCNMIAPHTCVVVDDDADWLELARRALRRAEPLLDIRTFADPFRALAELRAKTVDLVLVDVRMPSLDGFAFTRELRTFNSTAYVIIMSSVVIAPEEVAACGADDFVSKRVLSTELPPAVLDAFGTRVRLGQNAK